MPLAETHISPQKGSPPQDPRRPASMSGEMHAKACCNHDAHHPGRALQPRQGTQPCLLDRRKMHRRFAHLARHDRATQPETTGPAESNMTWHRSGMSTVEAWQRHWHPSAPSIGTIQGSEEGPRYEHQHRSASASASASAAHGMAPLVLTHSPAGCGLGHTAR